MEREKAYHAVVTLCRVLGVSPSGYWAWRKRQPLPRAQADAALRGQSIQDLTQHSLKQTAQLAVTGKQALHGPAV